MENQVEHNNEPNNDACDIVNVSGYRFVELDNLLELQANMRKDLNEIGVKGTILIAEEGINAALAGTAKQILAVRAWFSKQSKFENLWLKESPSEILPFHKLKVRIRNEIITFQPDANNRVSPARNPAPNMSPEQLKDWLDNNKNFSLLDTRNDYEIQSGTFDKALNLKLDTFKQLGDAVNIALEKGELDKNQAVVTFCTGGIRCEKAAPYLLEQGFKEVYQIEGGILNYFETCGDAHWEGNCFVFDDRAEISPDLKPTGASMCEGCNLAVPAEQSHCSCGTATSTPSQP